MIWCVDRVCSTWIQSRYHTSNQILRCAGKMPHVRQHYAMSHCPGGLLRRGVVDVPSDEHLKMHDGFGVHPLVQGQ